MFDNPFGYVATTGTNGLLHFKVEHNGYTDYTWLDITEVNNAYWLGQTITATFDRYLHLGGEIQVCSPLDMAELNAASWAAWAEKATIDLYDDSVWFLNGFGSIRIETTGGFDTYVSYPGDQLAQWDLSEIEFIRIRFYHENIHTFQQGPWIKMGNNNGYITWIPPTPLLNNAYYQWYEFLIPTAGDATWVRTDNGITSLDEIHYLEIHADTWDYGFTLWMDDVSFLPDQLTTISGVTLSHDTVTTISWDPVAYAEYYDLNRGVLSLLSVDNYGSCFADNHPTTSITDSEEPSPGDGFFYVIRAVDDGCKLPGNYGYNSTGTERVNQNPAACP